MAVELKHRTVATVEPSGEHEIDSPQWNETHVLTMATARILGRTATGTGDVQEVSAGTGLTLSGLSLSFNSTWGDGRYALSGHNHSGVYEPVFTKNTAFNKNFGTAAGTVAQGNDSRLSDSREWTAAIVGQGEAEAGTASTARKWTAQRVRQAIAAWWATITLSKADVGLSNVDDTSDADKPVSTATQTALNSKLDLAGGTLTGTVTFPDTGVALKLPNIGTSNPASTTNGDVWFASNTIRYNSNGTVRTVAHSAQWSLATAAELETGTSTTAKLISAERLQTKLTNWWAGSDAKVSLDTVVGWGNHNTAGYLTSVSWGDVGSKPATATRWPAFSEVTDKPATYPPDTHTHSIATITGAGSAAALDASTVAQVLEGVSGKLVDAAGLYTANAPVVSTGSGTWEPDFKAGRVFHRNVDGNTVVGIPSNLMSGQGGYIYFTFADDDYTLTFSGPWKFAGGEPTDIEAVADAVHVFAYYVLSETHVTLRYLGEDL